MSTRIAVATAIGCFAALPLLGLGPEYVGRAAGVQKPPKGPAPFATYIKLPSLGGRANAEAQGINDAGTVIVGRSFDRADFLYAVKWTLQNGTWVISALPAPVPYPGSAVARGIDTFGNVVGFAGLVSEPPRLLARRRRIGFARLQQRCRRDACDQRERPDHCRTGRQSGGGMVSAGVLHRVSATARSRRTRAGLGRHR